MIDLFIQVLICGIATAAISRTIAHYDGPFNIFPRLKESLLPKVDFDVSTRETYKTIKDLQTNYSEVLMQDQEVTGKKELWKVYHTVYNPEFYLSFRGTLYNIFDCPFCLGPYVSFIMSILIVTYQAIDYTTLVPQILLITLGSYGVHFIISKGWEQ